MADITTRGVKFEGLIPTYDGGGHWNYGGSSRFSITGDVNVLGSTDLTIPQGRKLSLDGGGHTYISEVSDSNLKIYVAASEIVNFTNDQVVFSKPIGIGATPNQFHNDADDLIVGGGSGNTGITIQSGTTGYGSIFFADGTADDATEKRGQIRYLQGSEVMTFHTDNVSTAALSLNLDQSATFAGTITAPYLRLSSTANAITITSHGDNNSFLNINHSGNESWQFKAISGSGSEDYITIGTTGGVVSFGEDGDLITDGDVTVGPKSNATVQVSESGGATVKMLAGSVGRIGTYTDDELRIVTDGNDRLTISNTGAATFTGSVTASSFIGTASNAGLLDNIDSNQFANFCNLTFVDSSESTIRSMVYPTPARSNNPDPEDYGRVFHTEMKQRSSIGSPLTGSNYWTGLISMAPYNSSSWYVTQINFGADGTDDRLYTRRGKGTSWGSWRQIITADSATFTAGATFAGTVEITGTNDLRISNGSLTSSQSSTTAPVARFTDTGVANYDWTFPDSSTIQLGTNTTSTKTFKLLNAGSGNFNFEAVDGAFTGNVIVTGNLEVTGTTTAINQENLDVSDSVIGLNRGATSNSKDCGLIIERGSTGDNAAMIWDESAGYFVFGVTATTPNTTTTVPLSAFRGIKAGAVEFGTGSFSGNITIGKSTPVLTFNNTAGGGLDPSLTATGTNFTISTSSITPVTVALDTGNITFAGGSDNYVLKLDTNNNAMADTAKIVFNDRGAVGWNGSAVYLSDNGSNKDLKLQVGTGNLYFLTNNTNRLTVKDSTGDVHVEEGIVNNQLVELVTNKLTGHSSSNVNRNRYQFLDICYNSYHWINTSPITIEIYNTDFAGSFYAKYQLSYGYLDSGGSQSQSGSGVDDYKLFLLESNCQAGVNKCAIGITAPTFVNSDGGSPAYDNYKFGVYIDAWYYTDYTVKVTMSDYGLTRVSTINNQAQYIFTKAPSASVVSGIGISIPSGSNKYGTLYANSQIIDGPTSGVTQSAINANLNALDDFYIAAASATSLVTAGTGTFGTWVKGTTGFRMPSGQAIDFVDTNIGYNSIERNTTVGGLQINTGDSASINILDNNNVGIGTSTPQVTLDVNVGGNNGMGVSFAGGIASGEYQGIHFGYAENANSNYRKSAIVFERQDSAARGKIHILNNAQNGSNSAVLADSRVTIQYDGNVGIGNTTPGEKLSVAGKVEIRSGSWLVLRNSDNSNYGSIRGASDTSNDVTINTNAEVIRFKQNGYVGVGTSSVDEKLQVEDGNIKIEGGQVANTRGLIIAHGGQTSNTTHLVQNSAASRGHLYTKNRALRIEAGNDGSTGTGETLDFWVNGSERMMIDTTGKVGIGETAPTTALSISGVANYNGITIKGSGASRPSVNFTNVNQGNLGRIYGTEGNAIIIGTGSSNATALTLDSSQNSAFAGDVIFPKHIASADSSSVELVASQSSTFGSVSNGTDVVTLTGWSAYGTVNARTIQNEVLVLTTDGANEGALLTVTTVIGQVYHVTATTSGDTGAGGVHLEHSTEGAVNKSTVGGVDFYFTASATSTNIYFRAGNNAAGTINIDNVSVKEAINYHLSEGRLNLTREASGDAGIKIVSTTGGDPNIVFNSKASNRSGVINFQDNGTQMGSIQYLNNGDTMEFFTGGTGSSHRELRLNETTGATFRTQVVTPKLVGDPYIYVRGSSGTYDGRLKFLPYSGGREWSFGNESSSFRLQDDSAGVCRLFFKYDGMTGLNTKTPVAHLQVEATSGTTFALSNSSSLTSGNRGDLAWYNSDDSTVANIRAAAVTNNVGTELQFFTRPSGGSLTKALTLDSNQNAIFSEHVAILDGNELQFGGGGDFKIWHAAGENTYLRETGEGATVFQSNGWYFQNTASPAVTKMHLSDAGNAIFAGTLAASGLTTSGTTNTFSHGTSWGTNLTLTNTNDDASPSVLTFLKSPASGHTTMADNDYVGFINFRADNSNNDIFSWVELSAIANDITDGSEDSTFRIGTWGNGTEYANTLVANSGNVGIGTGSPSSKLTLSDTSTNSIVQTRFVNDARDYALGVHGGLSDSFVLYDDTANATRLVVNTSGNLGLGSTNPTQISANTFSLSVGSARNDLSGAIVYQANGTIKSQSYWDSSGLQTVVNSGDARWYTGGVNDRMRITSAGNVGIGVADPGSYYADKFVVYDGDEGGMTIANSSTTGKSYLCFADGTSGAAAYTGYMAYDHNDNSMSFATNGGSNALTIDSSQNATFEGNVTLADHMVLNVGGGDLILVVSTHAIIRSTVSNADLKFDVNDGGSNITALTFDSSEAGKATFNNDVVAFSDRKLKKNIKTLDGSKVYDMRGVSFTRKDTGKDGSGVIAQEIQEVAPELVSETNGTLGVSYGNITGYLIEAIKDLKAEIEELKKHK